MTHPWHETNTPVTDTSSTLETIVNGVARPLDAGTTVARLVSAMCESTEGLAVAVDGEVVPRSEWTTKALRGGEKVEIVTAAAGG